MRQLNREDYLLIKSAARALIKSCGGLEASAKVTRVGVSVLSDYCHIEKMDSFMPLDVAADLQKECGGSDVIEVLAALAGGSYVPGNGRDGGCTMTEAVGSIMAETADVLKSVSASMHDGKITPRERSDIVKQIQDTIHACTAVLATLNDEKF